MVTAIGAIIMIVICVASGYIIAKKGSEPICKKGCHDGLEEITLEIKTINGEAPKFNKLPKSIQLALGSEQKYDDAIRAANCKRLNKNNG